LEKTVTKLLIRRGWLKSASHHGENIFFPHEQDMFAMALLEFVASPVGEKDYISHLQGRSLVGAVFQQLAWANGKNFTLLRFVLGVFG
jgi:hypothetical protein